MIGPERANKIIAEVKFAAKVGPGPAFEWEVSKCRVLVTETADEDMVTRMMAVRL